MTAQSLIFSLRAYAANLNNAANNLKHSVRHIYLK